MDMRLYIYRMKTNIYIHMPVKNPGVSKSFFNELGFTLNVHLTDEDVICMAIEENIYCMFVRQDVFSKFSEKDIADTNVVTECVTCISAESRGEVDEWVNKALFLGATENLVPEIIRGFPSYCRSFSDLDGHIWEILWMDSGMLSTL
jgi:predicted lactoylglutathione lyase